MVLWQRLATTYARRAKFATIYMREAHAADEWRLSVSAPVAVHRTIGDRIAAAKGFITFTGLTVPLYCDTINDETSLALHGAPEKLVIVEPSADGPRIVYISAPCPGPWNFKVEDAGAYLSRRFGSA